MSVFAALDVSQEKTAICVVAADGTIIAEAKVATCPDAITQWLASWRESLEKVGFETGPLAVWLWNALTARELPVVCIDARHANGVLKMMPNKTDRHDARGLAQIVRTGWFKAVHIKGHDAYVVRALLTARDALVGIRVRLENEIRGLLKTFGIMFGKRVGGFMRRAEEVIAEDLRVAPELQPIFETLVSARRAILERIRKLDTQVRAAARRDRTVQLFMTAPGVGPITALAVASAFDDPARFRRSSSAGAYLGLTPRRYESGEVSYNGRSSKRGDRMTRTYLYEAANSVITVIEKAQRCGSGPSASPREQGQARRASRSPASSRSFSTRCGGPARLTKSAPPYDAAVGLTSQQATVSIRCVPPGRVARMRSRPLLRPPRTAHTTSIHPPPTPTCGVLATTAERTTGPGAHH